MIFSRSLRRLSRSAIDWALAGDFRGRAFSAFVLDPPKTRRIPLAGEVIEFSIPNSTVLRMLSSTKKGEPVYFERREEDTMRFLRDNLRDGDVFCDIGAHIGIYVLLANRFAKLKHTIALEPEALNFAELCRNIYLNELENVTAIPLAAGSGAGFEPYYLQLFAAGNHSGRMATYVNADGLEKRPEKFVQGYRQIMQNERFDDILSRANLDTPNIILMDIDGGEIMALEGMRETLASPELRAIIIETRPMSSQPVHEILVASGFTRIHKQPVSTDNEFFVRPEA